MDVTQARQPEVLRRAAAEARGLLREALLGMQEDALRREEGAIRTHMLDVAEQIADVTSELFEQEHNEAPDIAGLQGARKSLREILGLLQQQTLRKTAATAAMGPVARALAVVFAACGGEPVGTREELAVDAEPVPRGRKGLVLVDSGDEWESAQEPEPARPVVRTHEVERRSSERVSLNADVGFVSESNFYAGLTMDVSAGGLFVATYQRVPVGTEVDVSFVLPDGTSVTTTGQVRWIREAGSEDSTPGLGVGFSSLSAEVLEAIHRFCRSRAPMYVDVADD